MHFVFICLLLIALAACCDGFQHRVLTRVDKLQFRAASSVRFKPSSTTRQPHVTPREDLDTRMMMARDEKVEVDLKKISRGYMRLSIFSWWCQIILSVVSGVILTFAQSVRKSSSTVAGVWGSGLGLASIGVGAAFFNAFWTWTMTRAARRAYFGRMDRSKVIPTLRRYSRISITISLVGMLTSLFGAEQIVGTLASKVLSSQGYVPVMAAGVGAAGLSQVQALDIFLVQANTNAIVAHFVPLTSFLWSQKNLPAAE